jgi:DNA-binding transcriptional LysR family regulator
MNSIAAKSLYCLAAAMVAPQNHPLNAGELSLERLASYPILTYSFGFTGRSSIEAAFKNTGMALDIIPAAADTDVIKTYVRLGMGIIAGMAYDPEMDHNLVARDLSHLIPSSRTKIVYLKNNYLPLYTQHFIDELLVAAKEIRPRHRLPWAGGSSIPFNKA